VLGARQDHAMKDHQQRKQMSRVQKWSICFLLTAVAVAVSYFWLDRPIALIAHDQAQQFDVFAKLTYLPELVTPLVLVIFVAFGLRALISQPLTRLQSVAMLTAASLAVAAVIKNQLKFAFGRTWPETWIRNNPSFIHDGVYGFNPFHGGPGFASFPSGHTTAICAVASVLWICYPRFRPLYAICIAAVAVGLIGANFHFLSDVIAGGFLGASIGWFTVIAWELGDHHVRPIAGAKE